MKKIVSLIATAALFIASSSYAQEPARRALAEELLGKMHMQETTAKMFGQVKGLMSSTMQTAAQETGGTNSAAAAAKLTGEMNTMVDSVAEEMSWDKMKGDYITIYAETFTEDELKGLIAFYGSPTGQAYIEKQPELLSRTMTVAQKIAFKAMNKPGSPFQKAKEQATTDDKAASTNAATVTK